MYQYVESVDGGVPAGRVTVKSGRGGTSRCHGYGPPHDHHRPRGYALSAEARLQGLRLRLDAPVRASASARTR